jgi:outer membrane autotransporter protein
MFSGSGSAGFGNYDSRRVVDLVTPGVVARGDQDVRFASVHGRVSHDLAQGPDFYVRPLVDLGATYVSRGSFREKGADGANLQAEKQSDTFVTVQPAIEFGGERRLNNGGLLRPYVRIGVTRFLTDNDRQITATLQGAPAGVAPFKNVTSSDRTHANVSLGANILTKGGAVARLDYTGQFSDSRSANVVAVKISVPF